MKRGAVIPLTSWLSGVPHDNPRQQVVRHVLESPPGRTESGGVREPDEFCIRLGQRIPGDCSDTDDAVDVPLDACCGFAVGPPGRKGFGCPSCPLHLQNRQRGAGRLSRERMDGFANSPAARSPTKPQQRPLGASRRPLENMQMPRGQRHQ